MSCRAKIAAAAEKAQLEKEKKQKAKEGTFISNS
jgi:hypothetical protein